MTLSRFRAVAFLEATSFLALLVATYVKRVADGGDTGVTILGPIHGILFIAYVVIALRLRADDIGWTNKQTFWILVGAVVPFGGYVVDWWLTRRWQRPAPVSG